MTQSSSGVETFRIPRLSILPAIYYPYHKRATLVRKALQLHPCFIYGNISVFIRSVVDLYTEFPGQAQISQSSFHPMVITRLRLLMYIFVKLSTFFFCRLIPWITIFPQKIHLLKEEKRNKGRREGRKKKGRQQGLSEGPREGSQAGLTLIQSHYCLIS